MNINDLINEWTATADEMETECQEFRDACEQDEDLLNDWEEVENNNYKEGYAAGLRAAMRDLKKII